ncbi:MAG: arginine--tRNA ligase [Bacteroidales bacterium]|jgi:arginyl-tRNA synthetase|nr:arginine--tRNA ligase [Bacteroidales bacterium]
MEIEQQLAAGVAAAVKALYDVEVAEKQIQVSPTRKEFEGHLTVMVFPFMKQTGKKNPEELGKEIGEWLVANEAIVGKYNVVKGFLNLSINASSWLDKLQAIYSNENYGIQPVTEKSPLVMIEYSSPNTNKPLHLGHLRNILLGWSLSQIMEACGNKVVKTNIVNDRGIHICKSMLAWQKWFDGATPESTGKKGDHLIGDCYVAFDKHFKEEVKEILANDPEIQTITDADPEKQAELRKAAAEAKSPLMQEARAMLRKWEAADPEVRSLWAKMNEWVYAGFDETYKMMGVGFDKIYYESNTYLEGKDLVLEGLKDGKFFRKEDGSVWADFTAEGLDQKLLLRKDGTSVYMTQDIGTAKLRYQDFPIDKMIYVVGNEQNYHFQVLSLLLDRLGFKWGKDLVHFSYGMVELPNGRMKSREGTVVDADDLMASMINDAKDVSSERLADMSDEEKQNVYRIIGLGALKYFLLKVNPVNNMVFNPAESIDFNGNTGPFIQYTHARIKSVLRKAQDEIGVGQCELDNNVEISEKEQTLIQKLVDFEGVVLRAGKEYSPAQIANYAYDLAKEYNQFYHDTPILKEEDAQKRRLRLILSACVARVIKTAMRLLGIEVPERM